MQENSEQIPLAQNESEQKEILKSKESFTSEILKIIITAAAIILPIRLFLIQPFYVKGASMEPNFYDSEYLIIDKISPVFEKYKRGEVIVFRSKPDNRFLIKRVIGLPGERVVFQDRRIQIFNTENPNGFLVDEKTYEPREIRDTDVTVELKEGQYYVLGDNRPVSLDSTSFGPIQEGQIVGRVIFRGLPFDRISVIPIPTYPQN